MFSYLSPKAEQLDDDTEPAVVSLAVDFIKFCVANTGLVWSKTGDGPYEVEMHPAQEEALREACNVLVRYFGSYHAEEPSGKTVP